MIHPNVGFKDAVLEECAGGAFQVRDAVTGEPVSPILFHNRKAARNWAQGRGMRVLENQPAGRPSFPRPLA